MTSAQDPYQRLRDALTERFGSTPTVDPCLPGLEELARMAEHRVHRKFSRQPVPSALLELLCACALCAPSKSDLQQADIIHVADRAKVGAIAAGIPDMPWISQAPVFLLFCGNNRRIRQIGAWRGKPFVNDHLDHFMNAAVDAGLVMMSFIRAAEAVGLGACPVSAVRNRCAELSALLELPSQVFPVAGLCLGHPAEAGCISPRLQPAVRVHVDRYDESRIQEQIAAYDQRRHAQQPYGKQRHADRYSDSEAYGWSEDKARQYSLPEREDFGAYIRSIGFSLK